MELIILYFSLFVLLLYILFFSSLTRRFSGGKESPAPLPPGKTGWPILGESLEFLSTGRDGTPEKFYTDRINKHSSEIFKTSLAGESMTILCGASGNKFLFSNENKLVTPWWPRSFNNIFPSLASTTVGEGALKSRHMISGFLKPQGLKNYVGTVDGIMKQHIDTSWDKNQEVTVYPLSRTYVSMVACRLFLSTQDPEYIERLTSQLSVVFSGFMSIPINFPGTTLNRAVKAARNITKDVLELIKRRKTESLVVSSTSNDILFHMLTTADEDGRLMTETEIADAVLGWLLAGHEPTSVAITNIMNYLAELPHIYNEVLKEQTEIALAKKPEEPLNWEDLQKMSYSWNVASEAMRLSPPAQLNFRVALTDFTFGGFSIPKGSKLGWSVNSTQKNPKYFPDPEKFDPSRFEGNRVPQYCYVPFGGGPRMCPGKEYARVEILVFMHYVVTRFSWDKMIPSEKIRVSSMPKPENGLPIRLYPSKAWENVDTI